MQAKYTTMQLLIDRLGAQRLLTLHKDFFSRTLSSVKESTARNAAGKVVETFLDLLRNELQSQQAGKQAKKQKTSSYSEQVIDACRQVHMLCVALF